MNTTASVFSSPSSIFWLTVVLVILGLAAVIVPLILWLRGAPRRRIMCSIVSRSRLLTAPENMREDLEITYQRTKVQTPCVLNLEIANTGRSAIQSGSFDKSRNLVVGMSVPVIKILSVEHKPSSAPRPEIIAIEDRLELKPELIVTKETINVSVLTEGVAEDVSITFNPLGDVAIAVEDRETWEKQRLRRQRGLAAYSLVLLAILAVLASFIATYANYNALRQRNEVLVSNCSSLLVGRQYAEQQIKTAYLIAKAAQDTKSAKQALSTSGYKQALANASTSAHLLGTVYHNAIDYHLRLGNTSDVPTKATQAVSILARLPFDDAGAKADRDLATVSATLGRLSGKQAIPPQCQPRVQSS